MRFKTAFERILFIMPLLCASLLWGTASVAVSGTIESPLDEMISGAAPGQKIGVMNQKCERWDPVPISFRMRVVYGTKLRVQQVYCYIILDIPMTKDVHAHQLIVG